ncbi:hypothetical protein B0T21DRAFT_368312 [Apiosordaria backusii]|uniref:Secreted protein n=1 Tax=Apiosordaria backusii TaxID=314023 RepID=A0AA40BK32_9PEZI|nr:hypothetical protein B0T21DRAFT_368312 [Apiosordaria backusii]
MGRIEMTPLFQCNACLSVWLCLNAESVGYKVLWCWEVWSNDVQWSATNPAGALCSVSPRRCPQQSVPASRRRMCISNSLLLCWFRDPLMRAQHE